MKDRYLFLDAYPWQISFQLKQLGRFSHICGGSVIDEHTIVCAAHCVVGQVEEQMQVIEKIIQIYQAYVSKKYGFFSSKSCKHFLATIGTYCYV